MSFDKEKLKKAKSPTAEALDSMIPVFAEEEVENKETTENPDFLDSLLVEKSKKKDELVLVGVYLQPDLAGILDKLGKKGGRGAKSRIVNDALRKMFTEKGIL
ncbi:hypothetical protein HQN89_33615 [Paenibacillus frigoriresistens]|uniref:hypothetical protein n=1 Tax=Paenibacillus alginolyticus TaxID=59839 RepID=UPI0015666FA7|nr:hypothetical protein [Paenibacillus frigoriresistens]NRF95767.1 hypothetical protein [Paenibacillus frigoriresistens]